MNKGQGKRYRVKMVSPLKPTQSLDKITLNLIVSSLVRAHNFYMTYESRH